MTIPKCKCGEPAEWADEYCQMCWEKYCDQQWWQMLKGEKQEVDGVKINAQNPQNIINPR
jgi:hypothetical protein